jgi:multiple sugar transport system permease protein
MGDRAPITRGTTVLVKGATPYVFVGPALAILALLMLLPILRVIYNSFFDNWLPMKAPQWVGLKNYAELLTDPVFYLSVKNTIVFTATSVVFHLGAGLALAVLLNQPIHPIALGFFRAALILPWIFTAAVVAVNWQLLLNPLGIVNYVLKSLSVTNANIEWFGDARWAMLGLVLVNTWRGFPFVMISILAGLQGIAVELYEAARVDGATATQSFLYITLPQLKPVLLSVGLLDAIWTFQLFPLIWLTTGGGPGHATEVLATYTYKKAFESVQFSMGSTIAVVILCVTSVLTLVYLKQQRTTD